MNFLKNKLLVLIILPLFSSGQTTIDEIISDMILQHEGLPHGVPLSYDWSQNPRKGASEPGEGWSAAIAWGQVYEWSDGSLSNNTRIQIKDLEMYYLSKTDYNWYLLQKSIKVSGANYVEDFTGDSNKPADIRTESDGSISTTCGEGYNFHFWPSSGRATIPVDDVAGCFVTVKARLILNDINGIDDRDKAKYLMSVGGDWWLSLTAPWDNFKTNWDIGIGRFRFITPEWKSYNMYSLPEDTIRNNPPPFPVATPTTLDVPITNYPEMEVFPVPCQDICNINFFISNSSNVTITAFDQSGKMVNKILDSYLTQGNHNTRWICAGLPHGIYILVLEIDKSKTIMKKIVH